MKASFLTHFHSDADRLLFSVSAHSLYFSELLQVTFDHFSLFSKIFIAVWVMANQFSKHGSGELVGKVSLYKTIGWWFVKDTLEYLKVHFNFFLQLMVSLVAHYSHLCGWFWVPPPNFGSWVGPINHHFTWKWGQLECWWESEVVGTLKPYLNSLIHLNVVLRWWGPKISPQSAIIASTSTKILCAYLQQCCHCPICLIYDLPGCHLQKNAEMSISRLIDDVINHLTLGENSSNSKVWRLLSA